MPPFPAHAALPADTLRVVEIHYYRVPRERWELMLLRARQSGANGVSSYIPWVHHEPAPGALDLDGSTSPERDLVGFVQLCIDAGLGFIAKPGPFCDSEMLGGGVPPWLLDAHPEWWAIRYDGVPFRHGDSNDPRLGYANEAAVVESCRWLRDVAGALRPFVGRGLWAVQIDNETPGDGMWVHEDGAAASPIRADFAGRPLPPPWTAVATLEELEPWIGLDRLADEQLACGLGAYAAATRDVLGNQVALFHDWLCMPWQLAGMLVEPGVLAETCDWVGQNVYAENVDPNAMIAGTAWYKMNDVEYVHHAWWRTRLSHTLSPAGMPHLVPEISARQAFYLQCSLIGGMDAPCIYMLHSSEPEPAGVGAFQRWAEEAPVLPDGNVFEWWWNLRCLFLCLEAGGADLAASPLPARVAIAYDHAGERFARWAGVIPGAGLVADSEAAAICSASNSSAAGMEIARVLVDAGIPFDVVDVTRRSIDRYEQVVVPSTRVMSQAAQARLARCSAARIAGALPTHDEHGRPHAELDIPVWDRPATAASVGIDTGVRVGPSGRRYVTVVNRSGTRAESIVEGQVVATNPATVTWFALDGERVVAAMLHGDDAQTGALECSQGQCAIAQRDDGAWHVVSQERAWIRIPEAAGVDAWRVLLHGAVLSAGVVGADGRFRFVHQDDQGQTDRYVLGRRAAADAAAAPVAHYFETTLARAAQECTTLGVAVEAVVDEIRETRSAMLSGTSNPDAIARLDALTRVAVRLNDIRLGVS